MFVDFENMTLNGAADPSEFDIGRVMQRVHALSRPIIRRAYADWSRMRGVRTALLRHAFDQVQTTYINQSKNGLDMQMCVDALETALLDEDIAVIFLITADSDFSALARALRRHGREVVGIGWHDKTNDIFRAHCDLFIDYEDLAAVPGAREEVRPTRALPPPRRGRPQAERRGGPARRPAAGQSPFLHDPRYGEEEEAGGLTSTLIDALQGDEEEDPAAGRQHGEAVPEARPLETINDAIGRLVEEYGPGARLYASQFMKAMRKAEPGFSPVLFGCKTLTEFVKAHPLLRRDPRGRGPNFAIVLPETTDPGAEETAATPAGDTPAPAVDLLWLDEAPVAPEDADAGGDGPEDPEAGDTAEPDRGDAWEDEAPDAPADEAAAGPDMADAGPPADPEDDERPNPFGRTGWWRRR